MRKQTNTLSPSPKGFQSPKFSDSDFREVLGLGLGRPKSSAKQYQSGNFFCSLPEIWSLHTALFFIHCGHNIGVGGGVQWGVPPL
jgi:hypothetical protein